MSSAEHLRLKAAFKQRPDRGLDLDVTYENTSREVIYTFDRLWTLSKDNQFQPDTIGAYRFLDAEGTLVFLVGPAPMPHSMTVLYANVPHTTRLDPGKGGQLKLSFQGPISEETAYFTVLPASTFKPVEVTHVELLLRYLPASSGAQFRDSALFPGGFELQTPQHRPKIRTASGGKTAAAALAHRRTDLFEASR